MILVLNAAQHMKKGVVIKESGADYFNPQCGLLAGMTA